MGTSTRDPIMADQTERAFQKQPTIFANKKGGLKPSESRFFCNPGLGFKIPNEAKTGNLRRSLICFSCLLKQHSSAVRKIQKMTLRYFTVSPRQVPYQSKR